MWQGNGLEIEISLEEGFVARPHIGFGNIHTKIVVHWLVEIKKYFIWYAIEGKNSCTA